MVDYGDESSNVHSPAGPDSPLNPLFWTQPMSGGAILRGFAAAHIGAGLLAAASALIWLTVASNLATAVLAAAIGVGVSAMGLLAFELARGGAQPVLAARVVLPLADLAASCVALWAFGMQGFIPLLFLVPVCVGALLFSWRGGSTVAALALIAFATISAFRLGIAIKAWAPQALALAAVMALLVLCLGLYIGRISALVSGLRERVTLLEHERQLNTAKLRRLLETVNLLEDTRARIEHEHALLHAQVGEIATVARHACAGDLSVAQSFAQSVRPGMYGPVELLAGALVRLTSQVSAVSDLRMHVRAQQRTLDALTAAIHGQAHLLDTMGTTLGELAADANRLVADIQTVERGSGELPGIDRHALFRTLRGVEQQAIAQASNTTALSARMSQLRERHSELESALRRLDQLTAAARAFESSGVMSAPLPVSATSFGSSSSDVFAASDVRSRNAQQSQHLSWSQTDVTAIPGVPHQ